MQKKAKILICLFFIFSYLIFFQHSFAKYVIENVYVAANLNIDRSKPNIEFIDIKAFNKDFPNYINKYHLVTVHMKLTEKNIARNNISSTNIKILVGDKVIKPTFRYFNIVSSNSDEKLYEFCFTDIADNGPLSIEIPENLVEDSFGLVNDKKVFKTGITADNIAPMGTFKEIANSNGKSIAQITCNEPIKPISDWQLDGNVLTKEFTKNTSYELTISDLAQNSSKVLVNIKKASNISLNNNVLINSNKTISKFHNNLNNYLFDFYKPNH